MEDKDLEQKSFLANRLQKRYKHLKKWARRLDLACFRVYDRDIPEIPLAIDLYEGYVVVFLYERPYDKPETEESAWLELMKEAIREVLDVDSANIFVKRRKRLALDEQYERAETETIRQVVRESGLKFYVNMSEYLDTGLFLDHRALRSIVRAQAAEKRVLNLFCYTGSFSVYALAGGAGMVTGVDLSNTYLAWAEENIRLNGLDEKRYQSVRSDVQAFLATAKNKGDRYDLIILDPPTFSNSKKTESFFDINRHWPELVQACADVLSPGGELFFSCNARGFKLKPELIPDLTIVDISAQTNSEDFRGTAHKAWRIIKTKES